MPDYNSILKAAISGDDDVSGDVAGDIAAMVAGGDVAGTRHYMRGMQRAAQARVQTPRSGLFVPEESAADLSAFTGMVDIMSFSNATFAAGQSISVTCPQPFVLVGLTADAATAACTLSAATAGGIPFLGTSNVILLARFASGSQNYRVKRQTFGAGVPFVITLATTGPVVFNLSVLGLPLSHA